jgi:putative chitinase
MMITSDLLIKIAPKSIQVAETAAKWFNTYAPKFEVNTPKRVAAFIAQAAQESDSFTTTREYASGSAYEGREDLGNTFKGDGKKFKGHGYFMTTGRKNHSIVSRKIFGDDRLLKNPELLCTPQYAMLSAFLYWEENNLNKLADIQFFYTISVRINGKNKNGLPNGWESRVHYYNLLCAEFGLPIYDIETKSIVA